MRKKIIGTFFVVLILVLVIAAIVNKSKCQAKMLADGTLMFDGNSYQAVSAKSIGNYKETNHLIGRTDFSGGWKIYEIKEYPEHEYVVVRVAWDGEIYKREE